MQPAVVLTILFLLTIHHSDLVIAIVSVKEKNNKNSVFFVTNNRNNTDIDQPCSVLLIFSFHFLIVRDSCDPVHFPSILIRQSVWS